MSGTEVIGVIPAAGCAARLAPLPCSKELYPIGLHGSGIHSRPKVVAHYLLEKMRTAGITQACIVLLQGKWDIPAYFKDGEFAGMDIFYRVVPHSASVPYTLDKAFPFTRGALVAFGFPDILFRTADAYTQLIARQRETRADVVLGAFPTEESNKWDMVELDGQGRVTRVDFKPQRTSLRLGWSIAVWSPRFSQFMHDFMATQREATRELIVGDVILAAIKDRLTVNAVAFWNDRCLDVGTPEDLAKALRIYCPADRAAEISLHEART